MKNKILIKIAIILGLIGTLYHSTFVWLYERYTSSDTYYSHGFLVPFITVYLIWLKKEELKKYTPEYNLWGLVIIIFSLILHFLSTLAEVFFVSGFSLYFLCFGITLYLFGEKITKTIFFPLFFLIFMFPLPLVIINAISFPMKMFATKSSVFVMKEILSLPVRNEGFHIFFPNASLVLDNPCSGLRSLITLMALGSVFAYFLKLNIFKKILFFLISIPLAIIMNIVRTILLCVGVYIYGGHLAKGFYHDFSGYFVFGLSFIILYSIWKYFNEKFQY